MSQMRNEEIENLIKIYLNVVRKHKDKYLELYEEIKPLYIKAIERNLQLPEINDWHYEEIEISNEMKSSLIKFKKHFSKLYALYYNDTKE